jgi:hypothetical protein
VGFLIAFLRGRATALTLAAAVVLTCSGGLALVFQPDAAGAGVTPGVKPDFTLSPGDTQPQQFSKTLVGSAEVKGDPDSCRTSPVTGLTCASHRIKLARVKDPSYQLTISLEWDAQPAGAPAQVPDVDLYLFDNPSSAMNSTIVGGAGQTSPEQIKLAPTQDEYDAVVQAYAGAIDGYKLTVSYTNTASIKAGEVTPDIVLSPNQPPFKHEYQSVIAAGAPAVNWLPDACRNDPSTDYLCDVYRIKLHRSHVADAVNFVIVTLDWDAVFTPDLPLSALALVGHAVPDLNLYVYDAPDHSLEGVGGASLSAVPDRVGFTAVQDEYDVVVQSNGGAATSYKLTASLSDELFDKPFELLDPSTGEPLRQQADGSLVPVPEPPSLGNGIPQLGLAPIDVDNQIAGIGLGATEQFDAADLSGLRSAMRNTSATGKPPSAVILWLTLFVVPGGLFGATVVAMRRRHVDAF